MYFGCDYRQVRHRLFIRFEGVNRHSIAHTFEDIYIICISLWVYSLHKRPIRGVSADIGACSRAIRAPRHRTRVDLNVRIQKPP